MKTKEITYFALLVDHAEKRYADYKACTEAQTKMPIFPKLLIPFADFSDS